MSFRTSNYARTDRGVKAKKYLSIGLIAGFTALFTYGFYIAF